MESDTACRVRWFYVKAHPVGNVPPERFQNIGTVNGTQGRSGLVRSALEKLSLFSPIFPVRQKHGAGISLSADSDSEGCSPSKNTSPAALSWSSLFGQTVLKSFCFCTTRFVFRRKAGTRRAVSAGLPRSFLQKKHSHRSESAFLVVPCTMAILCSPASPVQRLPLVR